MARIVYLSALFSVALVLAGVYIRFGADLFGIGLYLALVAFFAGYAIDKKE